MPAGCTRNRWWHSFDVLQISTEPKSAAAINNQPSFLTHLGDYLDVSYNRTGVVAAWQDGRESTADRRTRRRGWKARVPDAAAEAYRHGLRAAMRDGHLARREEHHLAELARTLGLDSVQALALQEEVEKELL